MSVCIYQVYGRFVQLIFKPQVSKGESIASEGKGDYLYVEGRVLDTKGRPISGAIMDTWETDGQGMYDTQVCTFAVILHISYSNKGGSIPTEKVQNVAVDCSPLKMDPTHFALSCMRLFHIHSTVWF